MTRVSKQRPVQAVVRFALLGAVIVSIGLGYGGATIGGVAVGAPAVIRVAPQAETPLASAPRDDTSRACPVTRPNGSSPPSERPSPFYHGNGALWTALGPDGTTLMRPENVSIDGSLDMKSPWWRSVDEQLPIVGQRLDAPAPPLRATTPGGRRLDVPIRTTFGPWPDETGTPRAGATPEAGDIRFQATNLNFPVEGCWEIRAASGAASLTVVTLVVRDDFRDT